VQQGVFIDPVVLLLNSPVTAPQAGQTMPLAHLCAAALQRTDNAAANLLLQAIGGPPAITEFALYRRRPHQAGSLGNRPEYGNSRRPARYQHPAGPRRRDPKPAHRNGSR
jgi:hypothetical protein